MLHAPQTRNEARLDQLRQGGGHPQQRSQNVQGAYAVDENWDITGWNIILVDDILTTGATLHEAAKVLFENGASAVVGAVCATHRENIEN